jgi:hypothetical protein
MARTRYPSLTSRLGLSNIRGPSGIGAREASQTTSILTRELNKMGDFFMKRAVQQAEIEGAEYGAENPITIQQIKESAVSGIGVTEQFDDNTVFGRSAKKVALESLGTELALTAKTQMSDLLTSATLRDTSLEDFSNDLKAISNEYIKIANNASPVLGRKLYAELGTSSAGYYSSYSKTFTAKTIDKLQTRGAIALNLELKNLPLELDASLNFEGDEKTLTNKIYGDKKNLLNNPGLGLSKKRNYIQKATVNKYTKTMIESAMNDWDAKWLEARTNKVIEIAIATKNSANLANKIGAFQKTGDVKIDAILSGMTQEEKLAVAKALRTEKTSKISFANTLQDKKDKDAEGQIATLTVSLTKKLAEGGSDYQSELMKLETLDPKSYAEFKIKFDNAGGFRTVSDARVLGDLKKKIANGQASFNDLKENSESLTVDDYKKVADEISQKEDAEFKDAMIIVAGELGFNPEQDIVGEKDPMFEKQQVYRRIQGRVQEEYLKAQRDQKNFDGVAIARAIMANEKDAIQIEVYNGKLNSAKSAIDMFVEDYPNKGIQPNVYTRANFERLKQFLTFLNDNENKKQRVGTYRNESMRNAGISAMDNILSSTRLP